jgi:predicted dehydrogenase
VSVHGTEGGAEVEDDLLRRFNADGATDDVEVDPGEPGRHTAQYDDILGAIANGGQPGITVQDAIDALATVRAVYIASTLQRPVKFIDVLEGRYDDVDVSRGVGLPPG